jgi:hypothetical protein
MTDFFVRLWSGDFEAWVWTCLAGWLVLLLWFIYDIYRLNKD